MGIKDVALHVMCSRCTIPLPPLREHVDHKHTAEMLARGNDPANGNATSGKGRKPHRRRHETLKSRSAYNRSPRSSGTTAKSTIRCPLGTCVDRCSLGVQVLACILMNGDLLTAYTQVHAESHDDTVSPFLYCPRMKQRLDACISATIVVNQVCYSSMIRYLEHHDGTEIHCNE